MHIPSSIVVATVQATILKRKIAALTEKLEERKGIIRQWAAGQFEEQRKLDPVLSMIEVPSEEGTLSVIFPKDKVAVRKGQELVTLVSELKPAAKQLVVVTEYGISKKFEESWSLTPSPFTKAERKVIERVIEWKPQTARVEPAK